MTASDKAHKMAFLMKPPVNSYFKARWLKSTSEASFTPEGMCAFQIFARR
jgi:hypothetical protein